MYQCNSLPDWTVVSFLIFLSNYLMQLLFWLKLNFPINHLSMWCQLRENLPVHPSWLECLLISWYLHWYVARLEDSSSYHHQDLIAPLVSKVRHTEPQWTTLHTFKLHFPLISPSSFDSCRPADILCLTGRLFYHQLIEHIDYCRPR